MDINDDPREAAKQNAYHRELERASMDVFMVYNPTDEDYLLEWDKRYFRIPNKNKDLGFGKGKMELERYLTMKYAQEMKDKIINDMAKEEGKEMLERRKAQGHPDFKDKYIENVEIWNKVVKTDNPELIQKIYNDIILGLVREYGMDYVPEQKGEKMDTRTAEEKAFDGMKKKYVAEEPIERPEPKKAGRPSRVSAEEVTNDIA